jgi:hypothetical protein
MLACHYELVEHALTPEQRRIYDAYAGAFEVIHNNLTAALEATHITGTGREGSSREDARAVQAHEPHDAEQLLGLATHREHVIDRHGALYPGPPTLVLIRGGR